jgi:hypothetical protein
MQIERELDAAVLGCFVDPILARAETSWPVPVEAGGVP